MTDNSNEPTRNLRPGQLPPLQSPQQSPQQSSQQPPPTQHQPPYGGGPGQPGQYGQQPQQPSWNPPPTQIAPGPFPHQQGYPQNPAFQGQPGGWPPPPYGPPGPGGPPLPPGGSGSGGKTGLVVGVVIVVLALVAGGAGFYFLLGPGRTDNSAASPPSTAPVDPSIGPPDTLPIPPSGPLGQDGGGDVDVDVEIGDCVTAGGNEISGSAVPADCGSPEANYKVIAKAETSDGCPSDANASYFESLGSTEVGALCLDVDWVQGDCFDLTLDDPQRVDCSAPAGLDIVRVENIVQGTSDPNECTEGGFPYEERNFIVCLEQL